MGIGAIIHSEFLLWSTRPSFSPRKSMVTRIALMSVARTFAAATNMS